MQISIGLVPEGSEGDSVACLSPACDGWTSQGTQVFASVFMWLLPVSPHHLPPVCVCDFTWHPSLL